MPTAGENSHTAAPKRTRRPTAVAAPEPVIRIDSEFIGKVAVTEALQQRHEKRITKVEEAQERTQSTLREVTNTLTAVAQQVEQGNAQTEQLTVQSTEMHDYIQDARGRQPEREQKDQEIAQLLNHLADAEERRAEREQAADEERKREADKIADQLKEHERERIRQAKRNTAYLQAIGGFVGLMLIALAPSSVGQTPTAWHPVLYVVYLAIVIVAGVVAVIRPLREQNTVNQGGHP